MQEARQQLDGSVMKTETAQEIMLDIYTRIVLHSIELRI